MTTTDLRTMTVAGMYRHGDHVLLFGATPLGWASLLPAMIADRESTVAAAEAVIAGYVADPVAANQTQLGEPSENMLVLPIARVTIPQDMPADIPVVCEAPVAIAVEVDVPADADYNI